MNNLLASSLLITVIVYSFINCHSQLPIDDKYNIYCQSSHFIVSSRRVCFIIKAPSSVVTDDDGVYVIHNRIARGHEHCEYRWPEAAGYEQQSW